MTHWESPEAIDTRIVFWAYAGLASLAGLVLLLGGPAWLSAEREEASLIRLLGSVLIALVCSAVALATVEDLPSRHRGLLWLAIGNTFVFCVVAVQRHNIWSARLHDWLFGSMLAVVNVLFYFWFTASGLHRRHAAPPISLFGGGRQASMESLRSEYERRIRQAASQEERNRLAGDLHDSIKQQLFVIQTAAATAEVRFDGDPAGAKAALNQVRDAAREAMGEMEVMLDQLRAEPLENTGLIEALKKQCEALGFRTGARVEFRHGALPAATTLPPGVQQAIFRVAQEALANIGKHSRASTVLVNLDSMPGGVDLLVQDDGVGFDPAQSRRGMGLANMRARAEEFGGKLELVSRPGGGTSLTFSIPYTGYSSREYREWARNWGIILVLSVGFLLWRQSPIQASVALVSAIGFTHEMIAWRRAQRMSEGSR